MISNVLAKAWWRWGCPRLLQWRGVQLGRRVTLYGIPIVSMAEQGEIVVGAGTVLCSRAEYTALGVSRPVILRTLAPGARIQIGRDAGLSGTVVCAAEEVVIGDECLIGADVKIFDTDFHATAAAGRRQCSDWSRIGRAPVHIGRNVFIGAGSIVCKGSRIGDNAIIGAGSVVTGEVPRNAVAAGNPARVLRYLAEPEATPSAMASR